MEHESAERLPETTEIDAPPRDLQLFLEFQEGPSLRRIPMGDRPLWIGKGREAEIRIGDHALSRIHCSIELTPDGLHILDLGSRNGTFVGGARVREAWGGEGTTIVVGRTTITSVLASADEESTPFSPLRGVAGCSSAMRKVAFQVRRLANGQAPVLVTGETGTGKELVARALHLEGQRSEAPFVALNVAALPRELVESELFGHERGAFTGATARRDGAFVEADGGTLFLDEIGELPFDAQPKLLRALDGYEVRRIGAAGSGNTTDVRVVAATHVALSDRVQAGRFRRDLYHRLEAFVVEIPPLRERPGDIVPIAEVIMSKHRDQIGEHELSPGAVAVLVAHDWPGNVRELRNVLLRASELAKDARSIEAATILRAMRAAPERRAKTLGFSPDRAREWLDSHAGNVSAAARAAQMPRTTFRKLLARTG
ncbi:MAG: sigma 54-interacting transcriptional regulator [Labilithrix sp.]